MYVCQEVLFFSFVYAFLGGEELLSISLIIFDLPIS
jgi:hypothetical protein